MRLQDSGADLRVESGDVVAEAPEGLRGAEVTFPRITVTGTENLLMAATLARGRTVLRNCAREPEVEDLAGLLSTMGARIAGAGTDTLEVEGVEELHGADHPVIPDRIEAGTYVIAAALAGDGVTVSGCRPDHLGALLGALREAGAALSTERRRGRGPARSPHPCARCPSRRRSTRASRPTCKLSSSP